MHYTEDDLRLEIDHPMHSFGGLIIHKAKAIYCPKLEGLTTKKKGLVITHIKNEDLGYLILGHGSCDLFIW